MSLMINGDMSQAFSRTDHLDYLPILSSSFLANYHLFPLSLPASAFRILSVQDGERERAHARSRVLSSAALLCSHVTLAYNAPSSWPSLTPLISPTGNPGSSTSVAKGKIKTIRFSGLWVFLFQINHEFLFGAVKSMYLNYMDDHTRFFRKYTWNQDLPVVIIP